MEVLRHFLAQTFWIPAPTLTEKNLLDQSGRVFIVTGGYAGVGLELSKILYQRNGTVYLAGRSRNKAVIAIESIKKAYPTSDGRAEFFFLDLADLATIKPSVEDFLRRERRLDVLTNNAGTMLPPQGSKSPQGFELQMATNCYGPLLFTNLLSPLLRSTAANAPPGSVRVTWAASLGVDMRSPRGGVFLQDGAPEWHVNDGTNYGQSKAGNLLLAHQFAQRDPVAESGVISNVWNPGNLHSELQRHMSGVGPIIIDLLLKYPTVMGAYTELFAGWAVEAGIPDRNGAYIVPWGRFANVRADVMVSLEDRTSAAFWEYCENVTAEFA